MEKEKNRLTRITSILIHLNSKRIITAKELASKYEVSLRTIYRDIKMLQDAGVPIGSRNGIGYFITEGFYFPPVMLTQEEATALLVSEQLILNQGDKSLLRDYESLLIKIKSVLKNWQKTKLSVLENRIGPSSIVEKDESNCLSSIQKAIVDSRVLKIEYHSNSKDELTIRHVEPMAISFTDKSWYMIAYCKLRREMREFKLSRILNLEVLLEEFEHRSDFSLATYYEQVPEY